MRKNNFLKCKQDFVAAARIMSDLVDKGHSVKDISKLFGFTHEYVYNCMKVLNLPDNIIQDLLTDKLTIRSSTFLARQEDGLREKIMKHLRATEKYNTCTLTCREIINEIKKVIVATQRVETIKDCAKGMAACDEPVESQAQEKETPPWMDSKKEETNMPRFHTPHIMLDLETLGTQPNSVIVSLGAVKFDICGIINTFYARIDGNSCVALGMQVDMETLQWWLQQADAPRLELTQPGEPVKDVLQNFASWINHDDARVWGNGSDFDNAMMSCAYHKCGIPLPWKYYNNRCYRTLKSLYPDIQPLTRGLIHHNALDDAKFQALHLMEIFKSR